MSKLATFLAVFRGRKLATIGLIWLCIVAIAAIAAPLISPFDPLEIDPIARLSEPGMPYLFGTDHFGRDTFSRAIYGARMAVIIGVGSVVVALTTGGLIGMLSAYFTRLGNVLMRGIDVLMSFPALLLALVLMTLLERSVTNTIIVIGIVYATTTARILFGMTLKLKGEVFVDAAVCSGAGHASILFRHILPNALVPSITFFPFALVGAIFVLSALDFLGFGLPSSSPSLGEMTLQAKQNLQAPWLAFTAFFTFAIMLSLLVFIFEGVRDAFDPRKTFS